ncbi:putative transposase, IS110 family [Escherichia coli]|uniref:Putative transposase, IS110 family n=1 Tax=Escherichia coli TaxID=562 RepID=A0A376P7Z3_ECOLX|nr:putative transposase, IS110 family [Escherichia coli]
MKYTPVGVDIAKHVIQIHFINEHTGEVVDKQLRRQDFLTFFGNREPCLIGMEACGGSQHWARELTNLVIKSGCCRPASLRHSSWQ